MKKRLISSLLPLLLTALPLGAAQADTAYVIDKLLVGVHKDQALDSAIIKVYPTGTQLQVLKREKDLAEIKGPDGTTGWVDSGYLMKDKPAALQLGQLKKENKELKAELEAQKDKTAEASPNPAAGGSHALQQLQKSNEQLKQQLATERLNVGELKAKLADAARKADSSSSENKTAMAQLRKTNAELRSQLAALHSQSGTGAAALDSRVLGWLDLTRPQLIALGVLLLLIAFVAGIYFMDALHRRKHGGFRV